MAFQSTKFWVCYYKDALIGAPRLGVIYQMTQACVRAGGGRFSIVLLAFCAAQTYERVRKFCDEAYPYNESWKVLPLFASHRSTGAAVEFGVCPRGLRSYRAELLAMHPAECVRLPDGAKLPVAAISPAQACEDDTGE